jgi:hypothetical protein
MGLNENARILAGITGFDHPERLWQPCRRDPDRFCQRCRRDPEGDLASIARQTAGEIPGGNVGRALRSSRESHSGRPTNGR